MTDDQADQPAPVRAAVALGRALGLPVDAPRVLHLGSNAVVHLAPAPVVARVARLTARARPRPAEALGREVALSGWLASRGAPVLPPTSVVDPGPHARDGHWMSLWPLLDVPSDGTGYATGAPRLVAGALAALHETAAGYPDRALPGLAEVVGDGRRALESGGGWLPAGVRSALDAAGERAGATAAAVDAADSGAAPRQALHGDAHPRNLLRVGAAVLWCDLEDSVAGPVEWDLAVVSSSRHHDGPAAVRAYAAATGRTPDPELLAALVVLRSWQLACWEVLFADDGPERRPGVLERLGPLVLPPAPRRGA